jgi:hypothetical protein
MAVLRAKTSFATPDADGRKRHVPKGTLVDSDDLVAKKLPDYFEPVEVAVVEVLGVPKRTPAKKV